MFSHLLVPIDGWPASDRAVIVALRMARALGAEILFCHVVQSLHHTEKEDGDKSAGETVLAVAVSQAEAAGVSARSELLAGNPPQAILRKADETAADLIIVGTTGRSALERLVLGSVSQAIVQGSRVPVVVVRPDMPVSHDL